MLTNPSVIALYGPVASHTADALAVFKTVMMGAFLTAVLGFVVVRRHTRTEEDEGRLELLGAGVVGRWSALAAAVTLGTIAVVAASVLSGAGPGRPRHGRRRQHRVRGRVDGGRASPWSASRAVVVQLASTTRGAAGLGFGFLGAMFALRAIADSADPGTFVHALGWLSPLGWAGRVEAYGANRTWILLLGVRRPRRRGRRRGAPCSTAATSAPASSRPAAARAAPGGCSSARSSLVTRLARGTIIGWTVGMVLGGVVVGSLLGSVADMVADPGIQDLLEKLGGTTGTVENVYLATEIHFVAVAVAAAGIALVLRLVGVRALRARARSCWPPRPAGPAGSPRTSRCRSCSRPLLMALLGAVVGLVGPAASPAAPSFGAVGRRHPGGAARGVGDGRRRRGPRRGAPPGSRRSRGACCS